METNISVTVPNNSLNEIIKQLQEREDLIFQKIKEIEVFRERFFNLLFLGFIIIFFLLFLNIYFIYRWKKAYSLVKSSKEKTSKISNSKIKRRNYSFENSISKKQFQNKYPYCQIKNCFFYHQKYQCLLLNLRKKVVDFSQKLSPNFEKENLINQFLKFAEFLNQNCYFGKNIPEKELLIILKKKLKKLRYNLNKIKKEKEIESFLKSEAKHLWQISHQITLIIIKRQNFL